MKVFRKNVAVLLSLAMIYAFVLPSSALAEASVLSDPGLAEIEEAYGIEFVVLDDSELSGEFISVSDLNELEAAIGEFINDIENVDDHLEITATTSTEDFSVMNQDAYTISWWAPFSVFGLTGVFSWRNVTVSYDWDWEGSYRVFTGIRNVESFLTGPQIAVSFHQTGYGVNYERVCRDNDRANFTIEGYYLLGVEYNGFPIGARASGSWDAWLRLAPAPGIGCF